MEVQSLVCQGMVEVKHYLVGTDFRHVRHDRASGGISHSESHSRFQFQVGWKCVTGKRFERFRIPDPVSIGRFHHHVLLIAHGHPIERLLEARDNLALTLQELQGPALGGCINDLSIVKAQSILETDY
jgi:hypothetical protein